MEPYDPRKYRSYDDKVECPRCGNPRTLTRMMASSGKRVPTYFSCCRKMLVVLAGVHPALRAK